MAEIIRLILNIIRFWNVDAFQRLRNSIIYGILLPLFILLIAAFSGGISWNAKLIMVEIELFSAAIFLIWLAYRRTFIALEIATAIRASQGLSRRNPIDAAYDYVRLVAAIIASELTAGLIVLWLPVHRNYPISFLALSTVIIFITYTIWQKGEFWWPKLVYRLAIFTLIAALFAILFPQTSVIVSRLGGGIDEKIAVKLECVENSNLPQCQKSPTPAPYAAPAMPFCAGGNFDFSGSAIPTDLKVDFRPDCITTVTLPPRATFRTDPTSDVKIVFIDGSTYLDGPGHQVWYGLKRGVFKMHGITNSGILKITIDKT